MKPRPDETGYNLNAATKRERASLGISKQMHTADFLSRFRFLFKFYPTVLPIKLFSLLVKCRSDIYLKALVLKSQVISHQTSSVSSRCSIFSNPLKVRTYF